MRCEAIRRETRPPERNPIRSTKSALSARRIIHGQVFGTIRPATTMVQVARLIDAAALVEIEADAVIHSDEEERG